MRHGSLFSGIGGFDLAAEWMGWENVFQVEKDQFCQKVLEKNFQNVKRYGAIEGFNGSIYRGAIDVLSGGFPCQSFSLSGKGEADLTLWKQMFRVVGEVKPKIIVAENVYGLLTQKEGMAFDCVCTDLENEGYQVQPYIIPACGLNAWHERQRVWIVANLNSEHSALSVQQRRQEQTGDIDISRDGSARIASNTKRERFQEQWETRAFKSNPTLPNLRRSDKPGVGRGIYGVSNRVDRIKSLGNSIVPQVAYEIFKAINLIEP